MALSISAIHKPLNDFFLAQFTTDADSLVQFRFDRFGSLVSDEDFIDPFHPDLGYSPALAREKFSDLVNHLPVEESDGIHVVLSQNAIDATYFFRLVTPSMPVIPADADDDTRNAIAGAFGAVKKDATGRWERSTLESSTGLMLEFKPALATPERWGDRSNAEIWTTQSFAVSEPAAAAPTTTPDQPLWRLRLSETAFQTVLQKTDRGVSTPSVVATAHPMSLSLSATTLAARPAVRLATATTMMRVPPQRTVAVRPVALETPVPAAVPVGTMRRFRTLDIDQRILASQILATTQPTQPAATNKIAIQFDYCLVKIERPWLSQALVNDPSWCIPATEKGALTAADPTRPTLALLPIAAVVIKNLAIEANWAGADIAAALEATDFGPFKVGGGIVNNRLGHEGLQIIGWLVQRMPALPPNGA
jgi:hypothetical protein